MAMAQLSLADLKDLASSYDSSRAVGDALVGEDAARLLIEASTSGNDTALQSILSQPQWIEIILSKQHHIHSETHPRQGPDVKRSVLAMPMLNRERILTAAAHNGQAAVVSILLAFATHQGIGAYVIMTKSLISKTIQGGYADVFQALASADANVINFPLPTVRGHFTRPRG
jgi:hypothetical protein